MKNYYFTILSVIFLSLFTVAGFSTLQAQEPIEAPYFQHFDSVTAPDLPPGWSKIVDNPTHSIATIQTVTFGPPISPPNNVRLFSNNNVNAIILLITPEFADLPSNRIRFWARSNHATDRPNLVIGTMSSPADTASFTPFYTIHAANFPNTYQEYTINFDSYAGDHSHIAFKFDASPGLSMARTIYIDDFHFEPIPAEPIFSIQPASWYFGVVDTVEISAPKTFTIENDGLGQLHLESVVLDNQDDFILDDLGNFPAVISGSETATFQVSASPSNTGALAGQVTITWHDGIRDEYNTHTVEVTATGVGRPAGSTCGNPLHITLPLVNYSDSTTNKGNDYGIGWVTPSTAYLSGHDMVFRFTLEQNSYVSGSLTTPQNWAGLVIVEQCPDPNNPAPRLHLSGTAAGNSVSFSDVVLYAGSYYAIVGSFNPPPTIDFTLNLSAEPVPPGPEFALIPNLDSWDFGTAGAGVLPETTEFTITNTGGGILEIISIEVTGDDDFSFNLDEFDFSEGNHGIELEEEYLFTILFGPESVGDKQATVTITYQDDEGIHTHTIDLTGVGVDVVVTAWPWREDFEEERFPPLGWSYVNGVEGAYWDRSHWNSISGGFSARAYQGTASGHQADEWLISPPLNVDHQDGVMLRFYGMSHNDHENSSIADIRILLLEELYDNPAELNQNAQVLDVIRLPMQWQMYEFDLSEFSGQYYIAFNYKKETTLQAFNWIYIDDVKITVPAEVTVEVTDQATGQPVEGAYVKMREGVDFAFHARTNAQGEANLTVDGFLQYDYTVRAAGYLPATGQISVTAEGATLQVELEDRVLEPMTLTVTTQNLEPGEALLQWEDHPGAEFRIDDGIATGRLGAQFATFNTVLGVAYRADAEVQQVSWHLTNTGETHQSLQLWIFGLDASGNPDHNDLLYHGLNIPNINNQWNTWVLPQPVDAPNGFMVGLSWSGFLGISTDTGVDEEWPFQPMTNFFSGNIQTDTFIPIEQLGNFTSNMLIRVKGYDFEELDFSYEGKVSHLSEEYGLHLETNPKPTAAGDPFIFPYPAGKAFEGYSIYLDDLTDPLVTGIMEREFLFEQLPAGSYTAGVQAVYTEDISGLSTIDFIVEDGFVPLYELTLVAEPAEGGTITGAGEYHAGETVQIAATAADGYLFVRWQDEQEQEISDEAVYQIVMPEEDLTLTAVFKLETGITEYQDHISVYPNPAREYIQVESHEDIVQLQVIDLTGKVLMDMKNLQHNQIRVDLQGLKQGIYLLRITTENTNFTHRIMVSSR